MISYSNIKKLIPDVVSYEDLSILYNENKEKIYMTKNDGAGTHSLDEKAFSRWENHLRTMHNISSDGHEVETYLKFAEVIKNNLRYVTFDEYIGKIKLISKEIIEQIKQNDIIFFVDAGDSIESSQLWVTLLFFGELLKLNIEEYKNKIFLIRDATKVFEFPKDIKIQVVHFDDMSYSGRQLDLGTPDKQQLTETTNVTYHLAISYVSSFANNYLKVKGLLFYKNTEIVPVFEDVVKDYYKTEPETIKRITSLCIWPPFTTANFKRGGNTFSCVFGYGQTLIYFDHKIADHLSTLYFIISLGEYPVNSSINIVKNSISKHTMTPSAQSGSIISSCRSEQLSDNQDCYSAFYKRFKYSFKGQEVKSPKSLVAPDSIILEINRINKLKVGGRRRTRRSRSRKSRTRRHP
jgi:hypothetical protein